MKHRACQYRLVAAHDAHTPPWHEITTYCIVPWILELHGRCEYAI